MKILEKQIENRVQFWSLLGPLALLLSLVVLVYKASIPWYWPISLVASVPVCIKWKAKGLCASIGLLLGLFIISYSSIPVDELYWHLGMTMSMALSLVILTLSLEESDVLLSGLQEESQSRLSNFVALNDKLQLWEKERAEEKETLSSKVAALTKEVVQIQEDKQTFQKLVYLAKDELIALRTQHEKLLEDLLAKKMMVAQLQERLDGNDEAMQQLINRDSDKEIEKLRNEVTQLLQKLNEKDKISHDLQMELDASQALIVKKDLFINEQNLSQQEDAKKKDQLLLEVSGLTTKISALQKELDISQHLILEKDLLIEEKVLAQQEIVREKDQLLLKAGALTAEISTLQEQLMSRNEGIQRQELLLKNSERQTRELLEKTETLVQEIVTLRRDLQTKNEHLQAKEIGFQQAENEKVRLLAELEKEKSRLPPTLIQAPGNTRSPESMYLQLREQFQEKSLQLDTARRELFHTQEKLAAILKEREEESYKFQDSEEALIIELSKLSKEKEEQHKRDQEELDTLYEVIQSLLKQIP